jgi:NAD-dependent deacetylase
MAESPIQLEQQLRQLDAFMAEADKVVFFGGAGVSTESGIPDFRSEGGQFKARSVYGHEPEYLVSHTAFMREPELFFRYYRENFISSDARPNKAHLALAHLEAAGRLLAVITQNVDGLHQAAGSVNVLELHGSIHRNYCVDCGKAFHYEYILSVDSIPLCDACGGVVKPDVVLYEEPLDGAVLEAARQAVLQADLMIVGGTSLVVYPAAGFVDMFYAAADSKKRLVIVNKGETGKDAGADLVIRHSIGEVLGRYLG